MTSITLKGDDSLYIYVIYDKIDDNIGKITHMIKNVYPEQIVENGVMTEHTEIPAPEDIKGMDAVPYIDLQTKTIYYEYVAVPPPPQPLKEQIDELKLQLTEAQSATLEMHESQAAQDVTIAETNTATVELYEILTEKGVI
ncbi:MAG: hypothetical protein ACQEXX_21220 [Bacillota bacterium]